MQKLFSTSYVFSSSLVPRPPPFFCSYFAFTERQTEEQKIIIEWGGLGMRRVQQLNALCFQHESKDSSSKRSGSTCSFKIIGTSTMCYGSCLKKERYTYTYIDVATWQVWYVSQLSVCIVGPCFLLIICRTASYGRESPFYTLKLCTWADRTSKIICCAGSPL